jgi:hypothetical protein
MMLVMPPTKKQRQTGCSFDTGGWFTASSSFANPAATIATPLCDTFSGICPVGVPLLVAAQFRGGLAARFLFRWLAPPLSLCARDVAWPRRSAFPAPVELPSLLVTMVALPAVAPDVVPHHEVHAQSPFFGLLVVVRRAIPRSSRLAARAARDRLVIPEGRSVRHAKNFVNHSDGGSARERVTDHKGNHFLRAFSWSSLLFNCSSFCPASPSLPSAVSRW